MAKTHSLAVTGPTPQHARDTDQTGHPDPQAAQEAAVGAVELKGELDAHGLCDRVHILP